MIIYFSGTRNSECFARSLAATLDDECINSAEYIKKKEKGSFTSQKPWVFVCPTYSWQIPHIFGKFIKQSSFSGNGKAYFIMTCGDDVGNAGAYNIKICKEKSFDYKGTLPVVMPENYIAMFDVPSEDECGEIMSKARKTVKAAAEAISKGESFTVPCISLVDRAKSGIVNAAFYALCVKSRSFYAKDSCTGCGLCEKKCVTNCISMKDGKPVWSEGCTHCMACICSCPVEAIEYGKKSVGKRRYICQGFTSDAH